MILLKTKTIPSLNLYAVFKDNNTNNEFNLISQVPSSFQPTNRDEFPLSSNIALFHDFINVRGQRLFPLDHD